MYAFVNVVSAFPVFATVTSADLFASAVVDATSFIVNEYPFTSYPLSVNVTFVPNGTF